MSWLWDGIGTLLCGMAGSIVCAIVYAMLPPYKALGASIGFAFWTPANLPRGSDERPDDVCGQLFPWPSLPPMIAYVIRRRGHGDVSPRRSEISQCRPFGVVLPAGAVVTGAPNSALPALRLSAADPEVQAALNRSIYWSSVQGLGNGFLFLVLVVAALIRKRLTGILAARHLVPLGLRFLLGWLMHSAVLRWKAEPMYAAGWLVAAAIVYSARWWGGRPSVEGGGSSG